MHHDSGTIENGAGMATKKRQPANAPAQLRRMYIDCRYGQLHLATAYPSSGGFDEASPLIFLHAEDGSGADFGRCAALLGTDRSIYAPDLPGSGASDSPKGRMAVAGLALAVVDLIDHLRLRRVDLLGCGRGAQCRVRARGHAAAGSAAADRRRHAAARNRHRPADAPALARSGPDSRGAGRRSRRRDPQLPRPRLAGNRCAPRADRSGRNQHRREQRQGRVVEALPADRRDREPRQ